VDDRVEVPMSSSLDLGSSDFTWSTWVKYTETTGLHPILWAYRVTSGPQLWIRAEPVQGRIRAGMQTTGGWSEVSLQGSFNDGHWHHVTLVRDDDALILSVDTESSSTTAKAGSVTADWAAGVHIGQRLDGVQRFKGMIDDVQLYPRALDDTERGLLEAGSSLNGAALILRLDDQDDAEAPVVSLHSDQATFDGNDVRLTVNAADDVALDKIVVSIQQAGQTLATAQSAAAGATSDSYTVDLSDVVPGGLALGDYLLRYAAVDMAGNRSDVGEFAFTLTDRIRPEATLAAPEASGPYSTLTIQVDATDNWGLKRIVANLYRDGVLVKSTQTAANGAKAATHTATVVLPDGDYVIRYNATDVNGNVSRTAEAPVHIDGRPPTVTVKHSESFTPAAAARLSQAPR
ncbi:MAG: LamG domain-containing protein, partial [Propionicimonas sp.]|nr:LamG domain-containing protein [Propionicimonas sp.]